MIDTLYGNERDQTKRGLITLLGCLGYICHGELPLNCAILPSNSCLEINEVDLSNIHKHSGSILHTDHQAAVNNVKGRHENANRHVKGAKDS